MTVVCSGLLQMMQLKTCMLKPMAYKVMCSTRVEEAAMSRPSHGTPTKLGALLPTPPLRVIKNSQISHCYPEVVPHITWPLLRHMKPAVEDVHLGSGSHEHYLNLDAGTPRP